MNYQSCVIQVAQESIWKFVHSNWDNWPICLIYLLDLLANLENSRYGPIRANVKSSSISSQMKNLDAFLMDFFFWALGILSNAFRSKCNIRRIEIQIAASYRFFRDALRFHV